MKLPFETYNPVWKVKFEEIKASLQTLLVSINPAIEHIGSTAVCGLSAKPIIDIQLGVKNEDELNELPKLLKGSNIVYYEKYNEDMPERRFFVVFNRTTDEMGVLPIVGLTEEIPQILHNHDLRVAHIHAFIKNSSGWTRHIAFRDYLLAHPDVTSQYQQLKEELVKRNWKDGNQYNEGKDSFLKHYEKIAIEWYAQENRTL